MPWRTVGTWRCLGGNLGLSFGSARDLHRHERENGSERMCEGQIRSLLKLESLQGTEANPCPLDFHPTEQPLISGWTQGDRPRGTQTLCPPPTPSSLFTWHSVTCVKMNSRFQRGDPWEHEHAGSEGTRTLTSPPFLRKAAALPQAPQCIDDVRMGGN